MRINWNRASSFGEAGRWLLLFLPLVAVGVALALMLTWGHQNSQQASADATSEIEFSISAPGCDTNNGSEADKCNFSEGDSFSLDMFWDGFSGGHAGDAPNVQMVVHWSGAVSGPTVANGKSLTHAFPAGCDIPIVSLNPGGSFNTFVIACAVLFSTTIDTGVMGSAQFNCDSAGVGTILMQHSNATSLASDAALQPHFEDNAVDRLTVNCLPPDGEINISKVAKDNGSLLGGSCWLVFALVVSGNPLYNPLHQPLDIVSDNQSEPTLCDDLGPLNANPLADLSDRNPTAGLIDINVPGALQHALNTIGFAFQEVKAPDKHEINDPNPKHVCILTVPKIPDPGEDPGKVTCVEGDPIVVVNQRIEGNINITFNDPFGGAQTGICVDITPGPLNVCDGDDGNSDGSITLALPNNVYSVALDPASVPVAVLPKPPTKVQADLVANKVVDIKFDFNPSTPVFEKKKSLANLFLTAQGVKLDPNTCEESTDVAVFTQQLSSAPASQNEKGDPQDVRAFEYDIRFDGAQVCVSWTPGKFVANNGMSCLLDEEKGLIEVGCVTQKTKPQVPVDNSNLELGVIEVRAQPSLYSIIRARQDNGVVVQIRNDQCNLADLQGHPITSNKCPDADLTVRWLEGDVNGDCIVDTTDQQLVAFRWGLALFIFNSRFDLVGPDGVINIKDVQFVFGRHNSRCDQFNNKGFTGPTNPPQPPGNKNTASP